MPKNGFKTDLSWTKAFKREVSSGMARECKTAAVEGLKGAKIEAPEKSGALRASGYVAYETTNGRRFSGYDAAIAEASRLNPKAVQRGQIELPYEGPKWGGAFNARAWAAIHFPLSYAGIIRDGFPHIKAKRDIPANDFLGRGVKPVDAIFPERMNTMLQTAVKNAKK